MTIVTIVTLPHFFSWNSFYNDLPAILSLSLSLYLSLTSFHCCLMVIWKLYSFNKYIYVFLMYNKKAILKGVKKYKEYCCLISYHFNVIYFWETSDKNVYIDKCSFIWNNITPYIRITFHSWIKNLEIGKW